MSVIVPEKTTFKVGDWVFCEFELQLIREMEDGRVREVTDAACSHCGYDLTDRCRPLTYDIKRIADNFAYQSMRIHREGSGGLNYPDIHRWLVSHWTKTCDEYGDDAATKKNFELLRDFTNDVLSKQNIESGYGFPLLRTRG